MFAEFHIQLLTAGLLVSAVAVLTIALGVGRDRLHHRVRSGPAWGRDRHRIFRRRRRSENRSGIVSSK